MSRPISSNDTLITPIALHGPSPMAPLPKGSTARRIPADEVELGPAVSPADRERNDAQGPSLHRRLPEATEPNELDVEV